MKKVVLVLLSLFLMSCGYQAQNNLSEAEKGEIKTELQSLMNELIKNNENGNIEKSIQPYLNSPEFISITNGQISDYESFLEANEQYFKAVESQKYFDSTYRYTFLDEKNVIVTWGCTAQIKMKNEQEIELNPYTATLVFKNMDGSWKIVYGHGSGVFVPVKKD